MNGFSLQALNWTDWAIIGIIFISTVISLLRGFVREALSLASWAVAAWVGFKFTQPFSKLLPAFLVSNTLRIVVAFAILFLVTLIIGVLINMLISSLVHKTGLTGTDRLLGMCFGIARGVLLVAVIVLLANMTHVKQDEWFVKSQLIPQFQGLAAWLHEFLPEQMDQIPAVSPKIM